MRVLIVESKAELGALWQRHIERQGYEVIRTESQDAAIECLRTETVGIVILDLVLERGSAFAVADFASYRQPESRVIFVTNTTFFSDGSIFQHMQNAAAFLPTETPPEDLAALFDYYFHDTAEPRAYAG
jgi:DNA-binding NtrC family response regulator